MKSRKERRVRKDGLLFEILLLLLTIGLLLWESWAPRPGIDDAYIFYRYVDNLLAGHGLVYNPGEYVNGNTSLLWPLLIAAGAALGAEPPGVARALGLLSAAGLLLSTWLLARRLSPRRAKVVSPLAAILAGVSVPFSVWATAGMETPLFSLLVALAILLHVDGRRDTSLGTAVLATLTRPEGALLVVVLVLFQGPWRIARRAWRGPVLAAIALTAVMGAHEWYYGSPLPNTFYAKVGGGEPIAGSVYLAAFLISGPGLLIPLAVVTIRDRRAWPALAFSGLLGVYVVWVGGDALPHSRFLLPTLPLLAALAIAGACVLWGDAAWRRAVVAACLAGGLAGELWIAGPDLALQIAGWGVAGVLRRGLGLVHLWWTALTIEAAVIGFALRNAKTAVVAFPLLAAGTLGALVVAGEPALGRDATAALLPPTRWELIETYVRQARFFEAEGRRRARVLRERGEEASLVATGAIGALGYYSPVRILDIYGLVDPVIARSGSSDPVVGGHLPGHMRSDADYVFSRKPDYILVPRAPEGGSAFGTRAQVAIWRHPELRRSYAWDAEIRGYRRRRPEEGKPRAEPQPRFYRPISEPGRWRRFRTHRFDPALSPRQRELIEKLEAIGYASGSRPAETAATGVIVHVPGRASPGWNFYVSGHEPMAGLMDMEGNLVHVWHFDFWDAFPDFPVPRDHPMTQFWRRARLLPNGEVLAIYEGLGMVKIDRDSNLLWAQPNRAHHDLEVLPDGRILVLTREAHLVPRVHPTEPILEDFVSVLDPDGHELRRVSILQAVERSGDRVLIQLSRGRSGDIYHTNSIFVIDERHHVDHPAARPGHVLLHLLGIGATVILDLEQQRVVWHRMGRQPLRHDPTLLPGGHWMIFDNHARPNESRVIEYSGLDGDPVWTYEAGKEFFSSTCGAAQRLPNGNTLITETDNGRAFEVDSRGVVVWEFRSPHRAGPNREFVASLFEMRRLPRGHVEGWLR